MDGAGEPEKLRRDGLDRLDLQSPAHRGRGQGGGIHCTTSKAIGIGARVRAARRDHTDPINAVLDEARGRVLLRGKLVNVARRTTEGFLRGTATVEGLDDDRGSWLKLAFQNDGWWPVGMAPRSRCRPI